MTTDTKILSLTEVKAAIKANLGSPQLNQNAATALAGTRFYAENLKKEFVLATILPNLSSKGKVQAELACSHTDEESGDACTNTHIREQSDWHQSLRCRDHAEAKKAKMTQAEKDAAALARAKAMVAKLEPVVAAQAA